jgi:hypothetical protein
MSNAKCEEALGKAAKNVYENDFDSIDFYKDIKYVDLDLSMYPIRKRPKYIKCFATAASLLIFILFSGMIGILLSNGSVSASRFNIEKQFVKLQNQFSVGSSECKKYVDDDSIVQEIKNEGDFDKGIKFFPDLFLTSNIPKRFTFESLTITKTGNDLYYAVYVYKDNEDQLLTVSQQSIPKEGLSISIVGITEEIKTEDGMIYISENPFGDGGNSGSYITDEFSIDVAGKITKEEILSIFNPKE